MDIFVFKAEEVRGRINVSGAAKTLHKVDKNSSLEEIKMLLRSYNDKDAVFVPLKGLYWMKKGTKQCVALQSDSDLAKAIEQYGSTNLCLACGTLSLQGSSGMFIFSMFSSAPLVHYTCFLNVEWSK